MMRFDREIAYVSPYPVPDIKAEAGQDVAMCDAFSSLGIRAIFFHLSPVRTGRSDTRRISMFEHYGLEPHFRTKPVTFRLPSIFMLRGVKGVWSRRINLILELIRSILLARLACHGSTGLIYTRDPVVAWYATRRRRMAIWEAVSFPHRGQLPFAYKALHSPYLLSCIAITHALRLDIRSLLSALRPVKALHVGVDMRRYTHLPSSYECKLRLNLSPERPTIVYTGWMRRERGVEVLVHAAKALPNALFLFVGGRPLETEYLAALAGRLGVRNLVFTGAVLPPQVPMYQRAADVLLLPQSGTSRHLSHYVSPSKLFEYMAAGRPIVASDLPCIREIVNDGETALLVEPASPEAWAHAILRVLNDRGLASRLSVNAARRAPEFDWLCRARRVWDWAQQPNAESSTTPSSKARGVSSVSGGNGRAVRIEGES